VYPATRVNNSQNTLTRSVYWLTIYPIFEKGKTMEEKLTWHKPEVQKMTVSMDTARVGSTGDPDFASG